MEIFKNGRKLENEDKPYILMCYYTGHGFDDTILLNSNEQKRLTWHLQYKLCYLTLDNLSLCRLFILNDTCRIPATSLHPSLSGGHLGMVSSSNGGICTYIRIDTCSAGAISPADAGYAESLY